jgi:hypothetical protein
MLNIHVQQNVIYFIKLIIKYEQLQFVVIDEISLVTIKMLNARY